MAQQQRPARSVGARGGHEGPASTPGPHPTSESAPTVPERAPPLRTPTARSPSAQARAPTTIRPAVAGRLTAPRVVASSPFRCRSRARLRAPQTSADGRSRRLVSYFFRRRPEPNRVQIPSGVRERRQGNPVVARRRAGDASAPRSCSPGRGLRIVRCRASRCLLSACSLAAAARSSVLPASDRLRGCVVGRRPLSVDSASRVGSFVRASRRHVDLPGVHTFRPERAFRWCAHLPVPGVHAVPAFPQGKINNLATLLGGRSAILVLLSWGPRGDPKRGVHTFLAHGPFGRGPRTFALANWSPENALASWCARSGDQVCTCTPDRGQIMGRIAALLLVGAWLPGPREWFGDPIGVPATLRVCTLGCLWCARSVLALFGTLAWTFAFFRLILPVGHFADAGSGGLAVAVGDNTRRLVFYPSDELAALLAEE